METTQLNVHETTTERDRLYAKKEFMIAQMAQAFIKSGLGKHHTW